jgi:ribosomal protein L19
LASVNLNEIIQDIDINKNLSVALQVHYYLRQQILKLNLKPGKA